MHIFLIQISDTKILIIIRKILLASAIIILFIDFLFVLEKYFSLYVGHYMSIFLRLRRI